MITDKARQTLNKLCKQKQGVILYDYPLSMRSTISIGGKASAWYTPASLDELVKVKKFLDDSGVRTIVIGSGSNVLIPDEGLDALIINLSGSLYIRYKLL